jgi:hypothetical protein
MYNRILLNFMMRHTREHRAVVVAGALETLTKKYKSSNEFQHCTSSSTLAKREIVQIEDKSATFEGN